MRSTMVMLLVTASTAGCAAQVPDGESEGATAKTEGSAASALRIGGGGLTETCPGGGAPACVTCSGFKCVWACAGDNTCATDTNMCAYSPGVCRTLSFSPGAFGKAIY
jgi:hypothetical protein